MGFGEQDDGGIGGRGIHLSPRIHQEHTFRIRGAYTTPAESEQEYLTSRKEYIEPRKTRWDEGTSSTYPQRVGELKQEFSPHSGQLSESEEIHLRPRVKQLICGSLNGMRIIQSLWAYLPQTGTQVPWKAQWLGVVV